MNCNVGTADRIIRVIIAIIFAILGFVFSPWWFVITVIALLTAIFGWCGLYALTGASTCEMPAKKLSVKKVVAKKPAKKRR